MIIEHIEKQQNRYVIASLDDTTFYLVAHGNCHYSMIDNIQMASKFVNRADAEDVCRSVRQALNGKEMVVLPLVVRYILLENEEEE